MNVIAHFPYIQVAHPLVGRWFEPHVEATVSYANTSIRHLFFLDSGADLSLIPDSLGQALGLSRTIGSTASVRGFIAERADLQIVTVHLQIGHAAPIPIRMGWAVDDDMPALLGRLDVFEHYTFELNHERRIVVVKQ